MRRAPRDDQARRARRAITRRRFVVGVLVAGIALGTYNAMMVGFARKYDDAQPRNRRTGVLRGAEEIHRSVDLVRGAHVIAAARGELEAEPAGDPFLNPVARGPNRAPGRLVVAVSSGTPVITRSTPPSSRVYLRRMKDSAPA